MLNNKGTNIFSEINSFFPENDNKKAINSPMDIVRNLRISSKSLSLESNANCKFTRLQVFELLLVFLLFMVKNVFHYSKSILGFKALFLCRTDGKTQTVLDFSLHGKEGSRAERPFGMTREQRGKQCRGEREETEAVQERIEEYTQSKIQKAIDMVRQAIKEGIRFDYLLSDSWFTCTNIVRFIKSRHARCHFLGMIKMAKTKYRFKGKMKSARELVKLLQSRKEIRYSRRPRCYYGQAEVELSGIKVKLFFCRRTRNGDWTGLITTNTKLNFFEAYHIYSMRWSIEVFFKESLLGLGKSQTRDYASQIDDERVMDTLINRSETFKHFINLDKLEFKQAA